MSSQMIVCKYSMLPAKWSRRAHFAVMFAVVLAIFCVSCRQTDVRTVRIHVPGLKNRLCAEVIEKKMREYMQRPGMEKSLTMDKMQFDFRNRTVLVEFDSMKTAFKNIEHLIAEAGFEANGIPANPDAVAKLPPECR